jgi:hypothetical protein
MLGPASIGSSYSSSGSSSSAGLTSFSGEGGTWGVGGADAAGVEAAEKGKGVEWKGEGEIAVEASPSMLSLGRGVSWLRCA